MPYAETESGTTLEDWTKKIDAIFRLCIGKDNDIKSLSSLNGQGMEQLGLLTSYFYLTDAKYADKFQAERTKYLERWQKDGAAEKKKERNDNKSVNRHPGMRTTKRNKVEEDMIASVKEQVFGQGAGLTGGVVVGGDFGGIGSVLKDFVALAQQNMILGFGAGDDGAFREEMAKAALLKLKTENVNSQLVLEQKQLELAKMQREVKWAERKVAADVDRQSVVVPSTPAAKAGASAAIDFSAFDSSDGEGGDCDDDE